eukprot:scaffold840_cov344-Pavlova_lutheri.AAC.114
MQGAVAGKKGSLKLVGVIGLPRGPFFRMIEWWGRSNTGTRQLRSRVCEMVDVTVPARAQL